LINSGVYIDEILSYSYFLLCILLSNFVSTRMEGTVLYFRIPLFSNIDGYLLVANLVSGYTMTKATNFLT